MLGDIEHATQQGAMEMLERIQSCLRTTRYEKGNLVSDQGGDIGIMKEIDRIVLEGIRYWTK